MLYTSRETGSTLTPEEQDVQTALYEYTTEGATWADWVSTAVLFRIYRHWLAVHRWRFEPDAPDRLTYRQFGRAIRRVFPAVERCRRSYHGQKRRWGYCRISGSESLRSSWLVTHGQTDTPCRG